MKVLGLALLGLGAAASLSFASATPRPVALSSQNCCEKCKVARYVPPPVGPVESTMLTGAALFEGGLFSAGLLVAMSVRALRRRESVARPAARPALNRIS